MKKSTFDQAAEQDYYRADSEDSATPEELNRLNKDMQLWVPHIDSIFDRKLVLDFGAGKAAVGAVVAQNYCPALVISLELVLNRLLAGKPWAKRLASLQLVGGNGFTLPFQDETFDIVVANSVLHHLPGLSEAVAEISRVLKPGGLYIGREPNFDNALVRWAVFHFPNTPIFPGSYSPNEYPLRAQEIRDVFHCAGLECDMVHFWRRLPWLRHPYLSVSISIRARRLAKR